LCLPDILIIFCLPKPLYDRDNKYERLPGSLCQIVSLERLDLRLNKKLIIPVWLKQLERR